MKMEKLEDDTPNIVIKRRPSRFVLMKMQFEGSLQQQVNKGLPRSTSDNGIKELIRLKLMKYTRPRKLLCRQGGTLLEIRPDGQIKSTKDHNSPYTMLQVISISANMIAMWGKEAQLYLAVNERGEVYSTHAEGRDCVFIERFTQGFYNTYESYHSVDDTSIHYYLTLKSHDTPVEMCNKTSELSEFYWDLPVMTMATTMFIKSDENNNCE